MLLSLRQNDLTSLRVFKVILPCHHDDKANFVSFENQEAKDIPKEPEPRTFKIGQKESK